MKIGLRVLAMLLALLTFATVFAGCKKKEEEPKKPGKLVGDDSGDNADENPYEGVDFGGRVFKVHINVKDAGFESSSRYIVPVEELDDSCNELEKTVFERDAWMAENLNMSVEYTTYSAEYNTVVETLRKLADSGYSYDLYIDKLFPMANFSLEGQFENVGGRTELQYFENYWYNDWMNSLSLDEGSTMYLLAGDYFIDVLRSSNVMFVNMQMLDDVFSDQGGSKQFLDDVIDGKWTYDELMTRSETVYLPGQTVLDTRYGLLLHTVWEPMIPMIVGGGATFAEISDGKLISRMGDDRNYNLFGKLKTLITSPTCDTCKRNSEGDWGLKDEFGVEATLSNIQTLFVNGHGLFTYGRFASMEKLGQTELQFSVIPYPKSNADDPYVTPSHDTTEIGGIPRGAQDVGAILQMLDIMCQLSNKNLIQVYYEEALKIKYSVNPQAASVVDLVHDNMGSAFALAYNDACSNLLLWDTFYTPLRDGRDYKVNLASYSTPLQSALNNLMKKWNEIS